METSYCGSCQILVFKTFSKLPKTARLSIQDLTAGFKWCLCYQDVLCTSSKPRHHHYQDVWLTGLIWPTSFLQSTPLSHMVRSKPH